MIQGSFCLLDTDFNEYSSVYVQCAIHGESKEDMVINMNVLNALNRSTNYTQDDVDKHVAVHYDYAGGIYVMDKVAANNFISPIRFCCNKRRYASDEILKLMNTIPTDYQHGYLQEPDKIFYADFIRYISNNNKTFDIKQELLLYDNDEKSTWECSACTYLNKIGVECKICCNPSPKPNPYFLNIKIINHNYHYSDHKEEDLKYNENDDNASSESLSEEEEDEYKIDNNNQRKNKPSIHDYIDKDLIISLGDRKSRSLTFESFILLYQKWHGKIAKKEYKEINNWFDQVLKDETPNCE